MALPSPVLRLEASRLSSISPLRSNFAQLKEHDEQLLRLGLLAEQYFPTDPNTSTLKLRQLAELLAQHVASGYGEYVSGEEAQYDLIRRLRAPGPLPDDIFQTFDRVRRAGNEASHQIAEDYGRALSAMKDSWQLGCWFHRVFKDPAFRSGPFVPPKPPEAELGNLRAELERLGQELAADQATHRETVQRLASTEARLQQAVDERSFWEAMALEAEAPETRQLVDQELRSANRVARVRSPLSIREALRIGYSPTTHRSCPECRHVVQDIERHYMKSHHDRYRGPVRDADDPAAQEHLRGNQTCPECRRVVTSVTAHYAQEHGGK